MHLGIDVSVHNGNINVKKIRDAGYKRIIIRAGYGKNNIDQKYVTNAEACINLEQTAGI
jgi:GH25 family lysozyme M1 (1,4-beta-N-acetylmuramidase)